MPLPHLNTLSSSLSSNTVTSHSSKSWPDSSKRCLGVSTLTHTLLLSNQCKKTLFSCVELLLTQPIDPNSASLPSPDQLKRKILIKHKKLTLSEDGEPTLEAPPTSTATVAPDPAESSDFTSFMMDLSNSRKNGYLYMQDPIDKVGGYIYMYMYVCVQWM